MGSKFDRRPRLTIVFAPATRGELNKIWAYNEKTYGRDHAIDYLRFLQDGIATLAADPDQGRPIEGFPELNGLTLKRSAQGAGHIIIYRVDRPKQIIRVLHIYHTAQDIQGRLKGKRR